MNLWVHEYAVPLCKKVFENYPLCRVRGLDSRAEYNDKLPARSPYAHAVSNLSMHLTEHAFITLAGRTVPPEEMNYIKLDPIDTTSFNLPKNYIVLTTGYTSKARAWKSESVNAVSDYIISKGFTPVYLGKGYTHAYKDEGIKGTFEADYSKGINLIDKTNIFEAHAIMANSKAVLGIDNGLLHLAALSDAHIIYGFTSVIPEHRLPYRNNIKGHNVQVIMPTEQELACIGCQSKMTFVSKEHDFRNCFYGPDDFKCLDAMGSDKWIEALKKVGV